MADARFLTAQPIEPPAAQPSVDLAQPDLPVEPGYLGLFADDRQEGGAGVRVIRVIEGTPAETAGLAVNDLIVAVDGKPIGSLESMAELLRRRAAGETVQFEVRRGSGTDTIRVNLARRPPPGERPADFGRKPEASAEPNRVDSPIPQAMPGQPGSEPRLPAAAKTLPAHSGGNPDSIAPPAPETLPEPASPPMVRDDLPLPASRRQLLGIRASAVTDAMRRRLGLSQPGGAHVVSRLVGSPADQAGIPLESIIVAVDDQPVMTPADLARLIAAAGPGKAIELTYLVAGERRVARVQLADTPTGRFNDDAPIMPQDSPQSHFAMTQRLNALERRIRELEQRVERLEGGELERGSESRR